MKCNFCNLESEDINLFCKDSSRNSGYKNFCKDCQAKKSKTYRISNQEKFSLKYKEIYVKDKEQGLSKARNEKRKIKNIYKYRSLAMIAGIKYKDGKIPVDLLFLTENLEEILKNIKYCPCCQKEFNFMYVKNKKNLDAPSIDRLIPENGYVQNNINIICWRCNYLKKDANISELENIINYMKNKQ